MGRSPTAAALCGSPATMDVEEDVHERLLQSQDRANRSRRHSADDEEEDDAFTHEELLHSIGSFSAVVWPVTVTMLLASIVSLNVVDPAMAQALADAYLVYGPDTDTTASDGTKFEQAVVNALVIVSFFLVATFVIVACYKFNFNRILIGYMMFSSAMLLGLLGGNIVLITISQLELPVDAISFWAGMYNFAVVGVIAVFYQKGTPTWLAQIYLVLTSVIMAWQLGQFPEWSTWALVVVLAFYDLCAVLTPCGPLKWLVKLVQQEGRPLPGLLYEAEVKRDRPLYTPPSTQTQRPESAVPRHETTQPDKYYQCEAEIPLRLGSPDASPTLISRKQEVPVSPSRHNDVLKHRLEQFYAQHNPAAIPRIDRIIERYRGREADLWHDLYQKYVSDQGDEDSTIKLGLGDFVFYSVLVSRAAMFDFAAMIGCLISILMGLGGTLFLLGIYKKALPALPISILLAVTMYFWMRLVYFPFFEMTLEMQVAH
ncbi:hypothetical protein Poli38472_006706 [Pythium oligandrum]|uniref:Presenilin n=1 Tax=Pythium oligandrum TaxID=41045 RepID=A0A8K1C597_PYTOL|nr:hypothetical protein Poli38472_006706 [Pythium oligandrum]|eukprot:TMW56696.1 hypothetical protein Poli38472_006706 [Pythium oligandrum]